MLNSRLFRFLAMSIVLALAVIGVVSNQLPISAQTDTPSPTPSATPPPKLTLDCTYPALSADVGNSFSFDIDIKYYGTERQTFNLIAAAPSGWNSSVTGVGFKQITAIDIAAYDVNTPGIETITVAFTPNYQALPGPGTYSGNIKVTTGTLSQTMELRATVTSRYFFALDWTDPASGSTTTDVSMLGEPGKTSDFTFEVTSGGSAEIKNLTFSAEAPKGWTVTFNPATLSSLASNQTQEVTAQVTPPGGSNIAGDFVLILKGDNGAVSNKMTLRINIPPSSTSVWVIVGVTAAVIIVLIGLYQFFGKKRTKLSK